MVCPSTVYFVILSLAKKEARVDEQERDYLRQQIRQLEQSNRRWKLVAITLAATLVIFVIVGAVSSLPVVQLQREAMMQLEQARAAEEAARLQAEQAAHQLRQIEGKTNDTKEVTPKEEGAKGGGAGKPDGYKAGKGQIGPKE